MNYRIMRTILYFDLPSVTNENKRVYRRFVKALMKKGFIRIQESVFAKLNTNQTDADLTRAYLEKEVPKEGNVMALVVTERQFQKMAILVGEIETDVIRSDETIIKL